MVACELDKNKLKRAKRFCRTFISSISLLLDQARIFISGISLPDLASSNLVQSARSYWISYFCEVYLQVPKRAALIINPSLYNHRISDASAGLNNAKQRNFVKINAKIINSCRKFNYSST